MLIISILLLISVFSFGQSDHRKTRIAAKKAMNEGRYFAAEKLYLQLLQYDSLNINDRYAYGLSLSKGQKYCEASLELKKIFQLADSFFIPNLPLEYAISLKNCGDYREAKKVFDYLLHNPNCPESIKKRYVEIEHHLKNIQYAIRHLTDSLSYNVNHLPYPINTIDAEVNPVNLPNNKLIYTSYKSHFTDSLAGFFETSYTASILESSYKMGHWESPKSFSSSINRKSQFVGNITFDDHYRTAYFTRCLEQEYGVGNCAIYVSQKEGKKWSKPKKLPKTVNAPNASNTQPHVARMNDKQVLIWASNRPHGYGGFDLYYSIIDGNSYSEATNLGSIINSSGNEITPFYDSEFQKLYFSSDFFPGYGGYDIFSSYGGLSSWETPENIGKPINSESNDLYYAPLKHNDGAYFSSNRIGSYTEAGKDFCCNDIYYANIELHKKQQEKQEIDTTVHIISSAQKIKDLLPLSLYFDNDIPDPKSLSDTTSSNYKDLLEDYISKKSLYKMGYSANLKGKEKENAVDSISQFFDLYVSSGFRKLIQLKALLHQELDAGKNVRLIVGGYASPLNSAQYNYHLSKRRIASLYNYLMESDSSYFVAFLNGTSTNGGRLTLLSDPKGDKTAARNVSSNPNDKRNSIYSKSAALERRIQILRYESHSLTATLDSSPIIYLKNDTIRITFDKNENQKSALFTLKNTGSSHLIIKSIQSLDPQLQLQINKNTIAPQEEINVYFLVKKKPNEEYPKIIEVKIKSNAHKEKRLFFLISNKNE